MERVKKKRLAQRSSKQETEEEVAPLYFHEGQYRQQEGGVEDGANDNEDDVDDDDDDESDDEEEEEDEEQKHSEPRPPLPQERRTALSVTLEALMPAEDRKRPSRRQRRKERGLSAGPGWFGLTRDAREEGLAVDAKMVEKRNVLDPKRFYKKTDAVSPFARTGTVIAGRFESRSSTLHKKDRKATIADQMLADQTARAYAKRKYDELQEAKVPRRRRQSRNTKMAKSVNTKHRKFGKS